MVLAAYGQRGNLSGSIFSASGKTPVAQATVRVLNKDSVPLRSALTDSVGKFNFTQLAPGAYILRVEALSYSLLDQTVILPGNNKGLSIDSVFVQPSFDALQGVVVAAKRPSIAVKTDDRHHPRRTAARVRHRERCFRGWILRRTWRGSFCCDRYAGR